MFYDEETLLETRFNILNKYVDFFVVVESKFFHNGKSRNLKFDINKHEKFKDKIIYIIHDEVQKGIQKINPDESEAIKSWKQIENALIRENGQRNSIIKGLKNAKDDDLILISDVDEIPNLDSIDLKKIENQIILFEQDIFYYKLNRYLPNYIWYGTKGCKKKKLITPQWLRNIKSNKYSFYRIDTFFSKTKYIDKDYIKLGGWHFSNIKSVDDIELKLKSYLHHRDYEVEELGKSKIKELIQRNETIYDMFNDKISKKFDVKNRRKLELYETKKLPLFIRENLNKYKRWMD
tara:strand:+ start:471 stop:1346 length:876 start_codon:yes stop_codon:yes gene_type:complete